MQLIYEEDDKTILAGLINYCFEPFLVLSTKACAREQICMTEREYTYVL